MWHQEGPKLPWEEPSRRLSDREPLSQHVLPDCPFPKDQQPDTALPALQLQPLPPLLPALGTAVGTQPHLVGAGTLLHLCHP